ncbi:11141_t:CDS:1, partial [Funneliformis mosseae]
KELKNKFKVLSDLFNDIKEEVMIQKSIQEDINYHFSRLEYFAEIPDDDGDETVFIGQQNVKESMN